jgi:3-deoxy-manno-octulosonate cytidylyltransferase (CMP-KDO synthetase)
MTSPFKIVIPARLASTRLPNKPLADIHGLPMIVRVAQRVAGVGASEIVVATDHTDILKACQAHGIDVVLTSPDCPSGTDRIAEVAIQRNWSDEQIVVNVQGDEPLVEPELIVQVADKLASGDASIATCGCPFDSWEDFCNPNMVKIALSAQQRALYFSRAPIPYPRDLMTAQARGPLPGNFQPLRHIGLYAYRTAFLKAYVTWPVSPLDSAESLEQLRALWNGHAIDVCTIAGVPAPGVDTPEDLERVRRLFKNH